MTLNLATSYTPTTDNLPVLEIEQPLFGHNGLIYPTTINYLGIGQLKPADWVIPPGYLSVGRQGAIEALKILEPKSRLHWTGSGAVPEALGADRLIERDILTFEPEGLDGIVDSPGSQYVDYLAEDGWFLSLTSPSELVANWSWFQENFQTLRALRSSSMLLVLADRLDPIETSNYPLYADTHAWLDMVSQERLSIGQTLNLL